MLKELPGRILNAETVSYIGKIENITGMSMQASGSNTSIGDIVLIYNEQQKKEIPAGPEGYVWSDYGTMNILTQINNCLNIQLRNLLSILEI